MSLINRIGKKYVSPVSPVLEPPPLSDDIEEYAHNVTAWASAQSYNVKPNCPMVYMVWKLSQQEKHIQHLEKMLEILIGEVASIKGEKVTFKCGSCGNQFSGDECKCR